MGRGRGTANSLTVIVKTFERPHCLRRLLASVRRYYPSIPVVVVDDSRYPLPDDQFDSNVRYVHTEFDIGVSEGRNRGVSLAQTEHVMILDDDMIFVDRTRLDLLLSTLDQRDFDIVGSRIMERGAIDRQREYHGTFEIAGDELIRCVGESRGTRSGNRVYDFCPNVFVARTDFLRANPWAPELKLREHWEFFYRLYRKRMGSVTVREDVSIEHHLDRPEPYLRYRNRSKDYLAIGLAVHDLKGIKSRWRASQGSPQRRSWQGFLSLLREKS